MRTKGDIITEVQHEWKGRMWLREKRLHPHFCVGFTGNGLGYSCDPIWLTAEPAEMPTANCDEEGTLFSSSGGWQKLLQTIAKARAAMYIALANDPNCIAFFGGDPLSTLTNVPIVPTGYSGAGPIAQTETTVNWGGPTYQININQSGPFFQAGNVYSPRIGGRLTAAGSPRFQGLTLLHEIGHIVGALVPEGPWPHTDPKLEAANNAAIASHCKDALASLSNVPAK